MTKLESGIKIALIDYGAARENWRVKVTGYDQVGINSDFVRVYVDIYKPRSRKPDVIWDLCVNIVKELVYFDRSQAIRPKAK